MREPLTVPSPEPTESRELTVPQRPAEPNPPGRPGNPNRPGLSERPGDPGEPGARLERTAAGAPLAPRRPYELVSHGDSRVDDWHWLRNREDPAVVEYLEAENRFARERNEALAPLAGELFEEMVARIQETDLSVPVRKGPWEYYSRTVEGAQYSIHCRRPVAGSAKSTGSSGGVDRSATDGTASDGTASDGPEQVMVDENDMASGHEFFSLGGLEPSPDHLMVAYSFDTTGGERHRIRVRDLQSGCDLPDVIDDAYYGLAWSADSRHLFYTRPDAAMRPFQVLRHELGTPVTADAVVYEEADERFYVGVEATKDERYVIIGVESKTTTESWTVDSASPEGDPMPLRRRQEGIEYSAQHWGDRFLLVTNEGAENFRLCWVPDHDSGGELNEMLPYDPAVKLEGIEVFARHLALYERSDAVRRIRVVDLDADGTPRSGTLRSLDQPQAVSSAWGTGNAELSRPVLRYEFTSMTTPRSIYEHDLETGETTLLKRQPVLGSFDPDHYRTWREWAKADDGTEVPLSVVAHRDLQPDGTAPCLLYGYGSYESSIDPTFSNLRLSLLDRGVVYAIAHVRGGGEMGRPWYRDGKLLRKKNTFGDFLSAARHLQSTGWAGPGKLAARGGSAGGMLMGVVANEAAALFAAIVAEVPFVDCLTTILDPTLPLTVLEWEEWGDPIGSQEVYHYMKSYSPYDNVRAQRYPDMLVTAGLEDPRVGFWEPAKWVAKLRHVSPESDITLETRMGAGHMGPSGRYDAWREEASIFAFLLDRLGTARPTRLP